MNPSRPQTILFADVSGSTRLFETKGDVEARRLIALVLGALTQVCQQHGGRVIKTIGDEIMCTFRSALQGVLAACDMQRKMARDIEFVRDNLAVRIGLHHGEALLEDNDVFGDAVNVAARMTSLAKREQIVTTASSLRELTGPPISVRSCWNASHRPALSRPSSLPRSPRWRGRSAIWATPPSATLPSSRDRKRSRRSRVPSQSPGRGSSSRSATRRAQVTRRVWSSTATSPGWSTVCGRPARRPSASTVSGSRC